MTLFRKNRDLAKNRRDQQEESGAVSNKTGMRRDQYGSMREGVGARRKERAARVAEKAATRQAEGKKLSKRQQSLAEEHSYNVGREGEKARHLHERQQSKEADAVAKQKSIDNNAEAARQKNLLTEAQAGRKNQPAPTNSSLSSNTGGEKSGITNPEYSERAGHKQEYTNDEIRELNENAKPDEHGVTMRYAKGKDGKYKKTYGSKDTKTSEASLRKAWTEKFGTDAVFPTDKGGKLSDAVKGLT
jgi:hypothetical protein